MSERCSPTGLTGDLPAVQRAPGVTQQRALPARLLPHSSRDQPKTTREQTEQSVANSERLRGVISLCRLITKPGETPGCMLAKPPAPCAGPGTASVLLPHYLQCQPPGTQRGQQNTCIWLGSPNDGTQKNKDDIATVVAQGGCGGDSNSACHRAV